MTKKIKKPVTHVAIILDKSGSMTYTKDAAISGYNEQVQMFRRQQQEGHDIHVSLVTFNDDVFEHLWEQPASDLTESNPAEFRTDGGTAMRDAIGYTIKKLKDTTDTTDDDAAYLVIVISDGQTNSDKIYSVPQLKEQVESCQASGAWTFTYLGCDARYLQEIAAQTAIPISNMAVWSNATESLAHKGIAASATRSTAYFDSRKMGVKCSMLYQSDTAGVANDYTNDALSVDQMAAGLGTAAPAAATGAVYPNPQVDLTLLTGANQPLINTNQGWTNNLGQNWNEKGFDVNAYNTEKFIKGKGTFGNSKQVTWAANNSK